MERTRSSIASRSAAVARARASRSPARDLDRERAVADPDERSPNRLPEGDRGRALDAAHLTADEDDGPELPGHQLELGDELVELLLERPEEELQVTARLRDPEGLVEGLDALPQLPEVAHVADRQRPLPQGRGQDVELVLRPGDEAALALLDAHRGVDLAALPGAEQDSTPDRVILRLLLNHPARPRRDERG
jgi:hypothetical protein